MREFLVDAGKIVAELIRRMLNALNWRIVRGLGELQILTKASYAMLVLVPILAGTWPAVRLVVNHHNRAVRDATTLLKRSEAEFSETLERMKAELPTLVASEDDPPSERIEEALAGVESSASTFFDLVNDYATDYSERTLKTPRLPWTLASAFFAALFVVLGHMLYQMAAPEEVRKMTWDEYVLSKKEDYAKHPSSEALIHARTVLQSRLGRRVTESEMFENERMVRHLYGAPESIIRKEVEELGADRMRSLQAWLRSNEDAAPGEHVETIQKVLQSFLGETSNESEHESMSVVERAARAEYLQHAVQRRFFTLLTTALYVCGLAIVISIIRVQTTSVVQAAGWTSPLEMFSP